MRLEPRETAAWPLLALTPVAAVAASLLLCAGLIAWAGAPVGEAYGLVLTGAIGSGFAIAETLTRATPLIFTGLAAAVAFKARFWNIGMEGQLYAGAIATVVVGAGLIALPAPLMIPLVVLAGGLAGALLLLLSALLKLWFGVEEIVSTLLLNFVVLLLVGLLLEGVLKDPMSMGWPQSAPVTGEAAFPKLIQGQRLHLGFLLGVAAALLLWAADRHTRFGYTLRAVGLNPRAAAFAGLPVKATLLAVALLSGGLAALAGVGEVSGVRGALTLDLSPGYGYSGIVVAMLAQLNPLGCVLSALFVAGVFVGADTMSRALQVPAYIADALVATSLICMLIAQILTRYRLRVR